MNPISGTTPAPVRYDATSISLHWIVAFLVIGLWAVGQTIDWFPRGVPRTSARSAHIVCGALLGLILLVRAGWRLGPGLRLPPAATGIVQVLASAMHYLLYAALFATVILGLANAWVRGENLFNLVSIPAFDPGNKALRSQVEEFHGWSANTLIVLAGLHAAAGLLHHYVLKDDVLRRMLPARRR